MSVVRRCFAVDLEEGQDVLDAYRRFHRAGAVPPEVTAAIRADGVMSLQIWQVADRMFMMMEQDTDLAPDPEVKRQRDAANPAVREWDRMMAKFQKSLPCAPGQTWVEMERIYDIDEQD